MSLQQTWQNTIMCGLVTAQSHTWRNIVRCGMLTGGHGSSTATTQSRLPLPILEQHGLDHPTCIYARVKTLGEQVFLALRRPVKVSAAAGTKVVLCRCLSCLRGQEVWPTHRNSESFSCLAGNYVNNDMEHEQHP